MSRPRGLVAASLIAAVLAVTTVLPASAVDRIIERGVCSLEISTWKLVTRQVDASTLLVRVDITGGAAGQDWFMYVTDNGDKIIRNTKVSGDGGFVRWVRKSADRAGTDQIEMGATNLDSGETCAGSLTFPQN